MGQTKRSLHMVSNTVFSWSSHCSTGNSNWINSCTMRDCTLVLFTLTINHQKSLRNVFKTKFGSVILLCICAHYASTAILQIWWSAETPLPESSNCGTQILISTVLHMHMSTWRTVSGAAERVLGFPRAHFLKVVLLLAEPAFSYWMHGQSIRVICHNLRRYCWVLIDWWIKIFWIRYSCKEL